MTTGTRLVGLLRLFRFELPFSAGVCVILGEILALGNLPSVSPLALGFFSMFLISATALILNDYFDLETDRVNAPQRPLPSGMVSKRDVVVLSIVTALLGLLAAWMLSMTALIVVFVIWVVGVLYNWRYKRTGLPGNLLVSFSVGMTFIFGGIAVDRPFEKTVWWFAAIVFLIDLGEEIAADAMDVEGDRLAGSRSLAVRLGYANALKISAAIFLLVVLVSLVPFAAGWLDLVYLLPIAIMDTVILRSTFRLLRPGATDGRQQIRWIYLGGLASLLVFIGIRIVLGQ